MIQDDVIKKVIPNLERIVAPFVDVKGENQSLYNCAESRNKLNKLFDTLLYFDPDNFFALYGLSHISIQERDFSTAISLLEKGISTISSNHELFFQSSIILIKTYNLLEIYEPAADRCLFTMKMICLDNKEQIFNLKSFIRSIPIQLKFDLSKKTEVIKRRNNQKKL